MKKLITLLTIAAIAISALTGCTAPSSSSAAPTPASDAPAPDQAAPQNKDTSLDEIKVKGFFIVGLDDSFPPMGYRDEAGEIVGFDIDLARAVAEKMGIDVKFQPVVWDNIVQEINSKNVDVIWNGCTITEKRKEAFNFSKPYMLNKQVVVVLKDSPYQKLSDLVGKKAGIQDGSSANAALDNNVDFKNILNEIVGFASNDKVLMDVAAKRLDCAIVDVCVFGHYNQQKPNTYRVLEEDLGSEEFGIAFHKESNAFREALQVAIDECVADGTAAKISQKWFSTDVIAK